MAESTSRADQVVSGSIPTYGRNESITLKFFLMCAELYYNQNSGNPLSPGCKCPTRGDLTILCQTRLQGPIQAMTEKEVTDSDEARSWQAARVKMAHRLLKKRSVEPEPGEKLPSKTLNLYHKRCAKLREAVVECQKTGRKLWRHWVAAVQGYAQETRQWAAVEVQVRSNRYTGDTHNLVAKKVRGYTASLVGLASKAIDPQWTVVGQCWAAGLGIAAHDDISVRAAACTSQSDLMTIANKFIEQLIDRESVLINPGGERRGLKRGAEGESSKHCDFCNTDTHNTADCRSKRKRNTEGRTDPLKATLDRVEKQNKDMVAAITAAIQGRRDESWRQSRIVYPGDRPPRFDQSAGGGGGWRGRGRGGPFRGGNRGGFRGSYNGGGAGAGSADRQPQAIGNRTGAGGAAAGRATDSRTAQQLKKEGACLRCGKQGHRARDCKSPPLCYNCGQQGHLAKDCKNKPSCSLISTGGEAVLAINHPYDQE